MDLDFYLVEFNIITRTKSVLLLFKQLPQEEINIA